MATAALVNGWHRSDRTKVVINGLVEEAAERARKRGWIEQVRNFPKAFETHWFDPEGMKVVYQDMLDESGVETFCYLVAGEPILERSRSRLQEQHHHVQGSRLPFARDLDARYQQLQDLRCLPLLRAHGA